MNTSEFARICRTERRTIHYYDGIGLLKPDHVQENGYREYSAEQVEQMDTIRILQSSGYTLKEIQKIMQAGSEARAEAFFAARDRIEERIRELQSMSDYIRKRKHQYEEFREIYPGYRIREQQIRYDSREVKEIEEHFFSFLVRRNLRYRVCRGRYRVAAVPLGERSGVEERPCNYILPAHEGRIP